MGEQNKMIDLNGFTGTENYYKASMFGNFKVTDGVQYLREEGNCYWLIDLIVSHQMKEKVRKEDFQVWIIRVINNKGLVTCEDGNGKVVSKQEIPYTDFEDKTGLKELKLFLTNDVIMLTSEY